MKTAMILAAGRGERLKPLTDKLPKPLCMLKGKPLIMHHLENLAAAKYEHIIINHAWLGGKIRQYIGHQAAGIAITYTPEPPGGLETAGGIINALPLLGEDPFAVINGDIYTDFDLAQLQMPEQALANLLLIPNNPELQHTGDFGLHHQQVTNDNKAHTFAGIACYKPALFAQLPLARYSLTPLLRQQVDLQTVFGQLHTGCWFDIGSMERYDYARRRLEQLS